MFSSLVPAGAPVSETAITGETTEAAGTTSEGKQAVERQYMQISFLEFFSCIFTTKKLTFAIN